jgi:uncharacterized protein (DUF4415 family)
MTERKRPISGDLKKADAYAPHQQDPDEISELTDADFARGVWHRGGKPLPHGPRGRPKSGNPKHPVSLRLVPDALAHFRRGGRGWQSRINAVLRKAAELPKERKKA